MQQRVRYLSTRWSIVVVLALLIGVAAVAAVAGSSSYAVDPEGTMAEPTLSSDEAGVLTISWTAPTPTPRDYRIRWARADLKYLSFSADNEDHRGNEYPASASTSLVLRDLTPGASYKVEMRARFGGNGEREWSGPWTQEVRLQVFEAVTPPAAATGLAATADEDGVDLIWTAPEHDAITGYRILRGADAASLTSLVADTGSTDTSYRDETVTGGSDYAYAVVVLSSSGESPQSATATVSVPEATTESASATATIQARPLYRVPAVLAVDLSGFSGTVTYNWQRIGADGSTLEQDAVGTGATYTLTDADAGKRLRVEVSSSGGQGEDDIEAVSAATPIILAAAACDAPEISAEANQILTTNLGIGVWSGQTIYGFSSLAGSAAGSLGATGFTTTERNGHVIDRLSVSVSGQLWLSLASILDKRDRDSLALYVCDQRFVISDAVAWPDATNSYVWLDSGLDWSLFVNRTIRLVQNEPDPDEEDDRIGVRSDSNPRSTSSTTLRIASTGKTTATVTATVTAAGTFYLRHSPRNKDSWTTLSSQTVTSAGDITYSLTGLRENRYYDVEVSSSSTFDSDVASKSFQNRPSRLDFSTGENTSGYRAAGIAGNADTLWVTIDRGHASGGNSIYKAFKLTPSSQHGDHDSNKSFTGGQGNHSSGGSWFSNNRLYAIDFSQTRWYVYAIPGYWRDGGKERVLPSEHSYPQGIWGNDDTVWVIQPRSQAWAYSRTQKFGTAAERKPELDITVNPHNRRQLWGIWSDGTTMWAIDSLTKYAYAYNIKLQRRWPELDIKLGGAHIASGDFGAGDLWGQGDYIYVLERRNDSSKVVAYYMPRTDTDLSGVTVTSLSGANVGVRAHLIYAVPNTTVYLRYRSPFSTTWSSTMTATGEETVDFTLSGVSYSQVLVEVSLSSTFDDGAEITELLTVRPVQEDFHFDDRHATGSIRGIWTNGRKMYTVQHTIWPDGTEYPEVYSYLMNDKSFNNVDKFIVPDDFEPQGLTGHSIQLFIVDKRDRVYVYANGFGIYQDGTFGGDRVIPGRRLRIIETDSEKGDLRGAHLRSNSTLYLAGHAREHVYAFNVSSRRTTGVRNTAKEEPLTTVDAEPRGIWSDGSTLWVVDALENCVYAYQETSSGVGGRLPMLDFCLDAENQDPWGITGHRNFLWVSDTNAGKLFAYPKPSLPTGTIRNIEVSDIGTSTATVTVTLSGSSSSARTVTVKYFKSPGGTVQEASTATTSATAEIDLTGLSSESRYALQASVGGASLLSAGFTTLSNDRSRAKFLKNTVVPEYEADYPWVRHAYDGMRRAGTSIKAGFANFSQVILDCGGMFGDLHTCLVEEYIITSQGGHATSNRVYLHEMGHAYPVSADLIDPEDKGGVGAGWLYFTELAEDDDGCRQHELYADAFSYITDDTPTYLNWFRACPDTGDLPSADTQALMQSIVDNEPPQWLIDEYEFDSSETPPYRTSDLDGYDEDLDLEEFWDDVRNLDAWYIAAISSLRHAFGGFCDEDVMRRYGFTNNSVSGDFVLNPWRAGGCTPDAPVVSLDTNGKVTWTDPAHPGGGRVLSYTVYWKNADQDNYIASRSASGEPEEWDYEGVNDEIYVYNSPSIAPGSTVLVRAYNIFGLGEGGEAIQPTVEPGKADAPTLNGDQASIRVNWNPPSDNGGEQISQYDLRYIRSDATDKTDSEWTELLAVWTSTDGGSRQYTITGLTEGVEYDVQVRAQNSNGPGPWSDTETAEPKSNDNTLRVLTLSGVRLEPAFHKHRRWYDATVGHAIAQTTVTATLNHEDATFRYFRPNDADSVASGHQVNLPLGETTIAVGTRAENGDERFYSIDVTRIGPDTGLTPSSADRAMSFVSEAVFSLEFEGEWTTDVTPDGVPSGAHFTRLIGGVHSDNVVFVQSGELASAGVELMAETGGTSTLKTEVQTAIDADNALRILEGSSSSISPTGTVTMSIALDSNNPRFTLLSMLGPSPDWFIGVSGYTLQGTNRRWRRDIDINLYPWDAGTEDGDGFSMSNSATSPHEVISSLQGVGQFTVDPIASMSLELQSTSTTFEVNENANNASVGPRLRHIGDQGSVFYSLASGDVDDFTISSSGQLKTDGRFDYEQKSQYEVVVNVRDSLSTVPTTVTVNVRNREEAGSLSLTSTQPQVNSLISATLTDPDTVISSDWQWQRSTSRSSGWQDISGATTDSYSPVAADTNYYLRATVEYEDGHSSGKRLNAVSSNRVRPEPPVNHAPEFPSAAIEYTIGEDRRAPTTIGQPVRATDQNNDTLAYSLEGSDASFFRIHSSSAQIRIGPNTVFDHETRDVYNVTVVASDPSNATASKAVVIRIGDVNERPSPRDDTASTDEDTSVTIDVLSNDTDPENDDLTVHIVQQPAYGRAEVNPQQFVIYTPNENYNGNDGFGYEVRDPGNLRAQAQVSLTVSAVNDPPEFTSATADRRVFVNAEVGANVGATVRARDVDLPNDTLNYELQGADAVHFEIDNDGQITVAAGAAFDIDEAPTLSVTVRVTDRDGQEATIDVTITVTATPPINIGTSGGGGGGFGGFGGGGGGGGAPAVKLPSVVDFEYNVTRDIEMLDRDHEIPTGVWSDGRTVYVLDNSESGSDAVYAYDLETGELVEGESFLLWVQNRFSHGLWSNGEVIWISDSGKDKVYAYTLLDGERALDYDVTLVEDNEHPRGIWSDGVKLYVLDSGRDSIFVYNLETGAFESELPLDSLNKSPRGIWSDGLTIWVSDDGANRIFAYRIVDGALVRMESEEFGFLVLISAGNSDIRGIWSDGDVLYAADAVKRKIFSYNLPDATQAHLSALSLSGLEIGEVAPLITGYSAEVPSDLSLTTVVATATQPGATITILPPDSDPADGHQVALEDLESIVVTVTSADGTRTRRYTVSLTHVEVNQPPRGMSIAPLSLSTDDAPETLQLDSLFSDADDDALSYRIQTDDGTVVRAALEAGVLTVTPLAAGRTTITVTASVPAAAEASVAIQVTVAQPDQPEDSDAIGQEADEETDDSPADELRIAGRRLADGRTEFAIQVRAAGGEWRDRILPASRFLPATAAPDRWQTSSALTVTTVDGEMAVRISARLLTDGRIEFALEEQLPDGSWAARRLPAARFLDAGAEVDRWLASSALNLPAPPISIAEVRIAARPLDDGRVEFALQERSQDGEWSERRMPGARFLPSASTVDTWLSSGALTLLLDAEAGTTAEARISARRLADGRIEFALQWRTAGGDWSERQLPAARYLSAGAAIGAWQSSSPLPAGGQPSAP